MNRQDDLSYHAQRATCELDLSRSARTVSAARAHFALASMHIMRLETLNGSAEPKDPKPAGAAPAEDGSTPRNPCALKRR